MWIGGSAIRGQAPWGSHWVSVLDTPVGCRGLQRYDSGMPARPPMRLLAIIALAASTGSGLVGGATLPRIQVAPDHRGFVTSDGRPFVPFGVNYYRPGTGWAPQVWKQFDPAATARDFARIRELGGNCVRVFLTYGSFYSEPGKLDEGGVQKLEQFLALAAEHELYVHPTGPDHWEGLPEWARGDRISDEKVLQALESFWQLLATRLRGRSNLFAYDLLNEPAVPWDTPSLRTRWNRWLSARYPSYSALTNAWRRSDVPVLGEIPPPPKEDAAGDLRLIDFQRFREDVAEEWTRRQAKAIRDADPKALVTVGLIQWSVPVVLANVSHYSAFRPDRQAPHVDFLSFHFYPLEHGAYQYEGPEAEGRNLAYLDCLARELSGFGKPAVLGEFGWHGGGAPKAFRGQRAATEEEQARWCRLVVETTRDRLAGWLNWGFHDQPEARDVSEFTGLLTADGQIKAWGRAFWGLAKTRNTARPPIPQRHGLPIPAIDWDAQVTSRRAVDAFRVSYFEAYSRSGTP